MDTCDKEKIGKLISKLRKEQKLTQKELAEKLMVSNKTISKWENGAGLPDISMLAPLADILGITITELLKGEQLTKSDPLEQNEVEHILQKTITMVQEDHKSLNKWKKQNQIIYMSALAIMLLEFLILFFLGVTKEEFGVNLFVYELFNVITAGYFTFIVKTELPAYYDENKISFYSDHGLRLNMIGLYFNNSNWRPIIRTICFSLSISMITLPLIHGFYFMHQITHSNWYSESLVLCSFCFFVLLFVPIYIIGNKYE